MQDKNLVTITALLCLTVLEIFAMFHGINGQIFSFVIGAVCLLAGYKIKESVPEDVVTRIREKIP